VNVILGCFMEHSHAAIMLAPFIAIVSAALQIPEVMPTTSTNPALCDGDDQEWQRWLQELFCSGEHQLAYNTYLE